MKSWWENYKTLLLLKAMMLMVRFLMLTRSGDWIWSKWSSSKPFLWNRQTVRGWRSLLIVCIPTCASTPTTSTYPCVSWTSSLPTLSTRMVIVFHHLTINFHRERLIKYARLGGHSQFVSDPPFLLNSSTTIDSLSPFPDAVPQTRPMGCFSLSFKVPMGWSTFTLTLILPKNWL